MGFKLPFSRESLRVLGPGLITGAADDDPSGIATYAQAGAQFGTALNWTLLISLPLMVTVQMISARIGRVTGCGLGAALRRFGPRWLALSVVAMLAAANVINLGADIGAMADAAHMLIGGPTPIYALLVALACAAAEIWVAYPRYVRVLKWLTLSLLAYPLLLIVSHVPWKAALLDTFLPHGRLDHARFMMIIAVLGTTISPYLFFWQAAEEAEDLLTETDPRPLRAHSQDAGPELHRITTDTWIGMSYSNLVAWSIIVGSAVTLHTHGIGNINTSADAAKALMPIAGHFAGVVFALGIFGTGVLAIPTLAGSVAYALGETMGWPVGLNKKPSEAKYFYAVIAISTLIGAAIVFSPLSPIQALVWSAVINGVMAVPMIIAVVWLGSQSKVMGKLTLPLWQKILGWTAAFVMAACTIGMFVP